MSDPHGSGARYGQPTADRYGQVPADPYATPYGGQASYSPPPNLYGSYGSYDANTSIYGVYGYQAPAKSKTTAALLAFFLGQFGAHSFYLGKKGLGLTHLGLVIGGWTLTILFGVLATSNPASEDMFFGFLALAWLLPTVNGIWAFIEFIIILVRPEHELGR